MPYKFSVTFERYLPHADEDDISEADEIGFVSKDGTLRDAIADFGGTRGNIEANESPCVAPRWFTAYDYNDGTRERYEQGITEVRSLHLPDTLSDASRRRIARLLGVKTRGR